MVKGI